MITPFGLRHIGLVRELESASVVLDPRSALLETVATPVRVALRGYFWRGSGDFTYVLRASDHATTQCGFAQAKALKSGLAWKITRMAPALDSSEDAATIWYRLLLHLCIAAGEQHVQRLFACVPQDASAEDVFRQASFAIYCHERVFASSPDRPVRGELSTRMRPMRPEHHWDVQRLYHKATPRLVLQAEELNDTRNDSLPWNLPSLNSQQGYVLLGQGEEIQGCLYVGTGSRGSWLRLIPHPDAGDGAAEMLDHALSVLDSGASQPGGSRATPTIYCVVREYEGGIQALLEERGFASVGTCSLLVKHTTVQVREPQRKLVPVLEKRAGVAPTVSRSERAALSNE